MFVIYLGFLALASAAPQYGYPSLRIPPPYRPHGHLSSEYFRDNVFDLGNFWNHFNVQMEQLETAIEEISKHIATTETQSAGVEGNEYVVTMSLNGFEENEIKVKARTGILVIQAVHQIENGIGERSLVNMNTLPSYVNVNGSWTFNNGVLRIVFPLNGKPDDSEVVTVQPVITDDSKEEQPNREDAEKSREEMDININQGTNRDADVGLERGDKDKEILTNVIPDSNTVEATTYAVDLKDEVEFVPIKY